MVFIRQSCRLSQQTDEHLLQFHLEVISAKTKDITGPSYISLSEHPLCSKFVQKLYINNTLTDVNIFAKVSNKNIKSVFANSDETQLLGH